jgi:hypothetical protein
MFGGKFAEFAREESFVDERVFSMIRELQAGFVEYYLF